MRKKLLSLALTLALCLGLAIPAFAAELPNDAEEAFENVSLSYPLGGEHYGSFDSKVYVDTPWTRYYEDDMGEVPEEVVETIPGYVAMRPNTQFTLSCSGPADDTITRVYLNTYIKDENGRYVWEDCPNGDYLTNDEGFIPFNPEYFDAEEPGDIVELTGGQSVQFTLGDGTEDAIYALTVVKYYPEVYEATDEEDNDSLVTSYRYRYLYLKVDEAAVDKYLEELGNTEPTDPVEPVEPTDPVEPEQPTDPAATGFTDVSDGDYFANPVRWAVANNITSGMGDGSFGAANTCSRAQILTFLYAAAGRPEPTVENPFADVKDTDYFYKPALWAAEKGLVSGDTFAADTPCTRASTMEYLWKSAGSPEAAYDGRFEDVAADADYAQAVAWAVENGVTAGVGEGAFGSEATCTRGQIMTFLYVVYGK